MRTPITHVRYIGLAVPDFETEREFCSGIWGLTEEDGGHDHVFLGARGSPEPFILRLMRGAQRSTNLFSLAAEDRGGVDALAAHLQGKGVALVSEPRELDTIGGGYGFRLFDRDGRLIEISADVSMRASPPPEHRSGLPMGIAHVVFETPDIKATVAWYQEMLGLRAADWLDEAMCFLRGSSSKHHCIAFMSGPPTLNHVAFELASMDELMRGLGRMLKNGIRLTWGPGRHVAGDNSFAYFRTPAGNIFEYTAEIEHLPEDWVPRVLPRTAEMIDQWGTGRIAGEQTGTAANWQNMPDPGLWSEDPFERASTGVPA